MKKIEMINLPRIIRNKPLKSSVAFCSIKEPSIVYNYKSAISGKIFNYNSTIVNRSI